MQSLASLMSMKQADIGNLDDFEEENEEDEENRVNQEEKTAKITGDWLKTICIPLTLFWWTEIHRPTWIKVTHVAALLESSIKPEHSNMLTTSQHSRFSVTFPVLLLVNQSAKPAMLQLAN